MSEISERHHREDLTKQYLALDIAVLGAKAEGTFSEETIQEVASAVGIKEDLLGRARAYAVDEGKIFYSHGGYYAPTPEYSTVDYSETRQTTLWNMLNEVQAQKRALRDRGRMLLELTQLEIPL